MKYKLDTAKYFYQDKEDIKKLEALGFTFKEWENQMCIQGNPIIEINSLEEMRNLIEKFGDIIVGTKSIFDEQDTICIYNDYVE